jgi:hypothetical protein
MSTPLLYCRFVKAYDTGEGIISLAKDIIKNFQKGHFQTLECRHNPPCRKLSGSEGEELMDRMEKLAEEGKLDD